MWNQLVLVTVVSLLQIVAGASFGKQDESEGRIVGGRNAEQGMFPWTVALFYNNQFICTASVISPTDVLTAAHCVVFEGIVQPASSYYGIAGNVNKSSPEYRINFSGLTPHPDYNSQDINNDLAIFKASEPIPFGDELRPICIAAPDSDSGYRTAQIMGWGNTNRFRFASTIPDILQWANQRIVPNNLCAAIYGEVNAQKVCATGLLNGVCNGDSGGPLVHNRDDGTPIEIGITSYINAVIGCGKLIGPAVFTRVSSYNDFILQTADASNVCVA